VENLSLADRKFGISTNIVVAYDSDVGKVQSILCGAAAAQPRVMSDPAPIAFLLNFVPDGLEFNLNFWVSDPEKGRDNLRSEINIAILEGLREAGIAVAYPQRVVRIDSLPPIVVPADQARL
jgi:small-conductance mechanosensitive channel